MTKFTRRKLVKLGLGAAALGGARGFGASANEVYAQSLSSSTPLAASNFGLVAAGKLKPRPSSSIAASALSIGCETLDRKMFDPARTYPHLAKLGVKWARLQTGWARTETVKGVYDFAWLDEVVDSLKRIGIQPWFNLGYGNRLYTPAAPDAAAVGWAPMFTESARAGWTAYVRRAAEHYRSRVQHWEIWNEANTTGFWKPEKPTPESYVQMVKMTAPEIRKLVPDAVIIGGALGDIPEALHYLERCMELGLGDHVDKISFHPYRAIPESNYESHVEAFRRLLARYKPGIELWQSENGAPSENGGTGALAALDWNETRQAKWLLRRLLTDLKHNIELTSYFHAVDLTNYNWGQGATGKANFKGILRGRDYTPKPSYFAYQHLCALFDSETKRTDLTMHFGDLVMWKGASENANVTTATFMRGDFPVCAYWHPSLPQADWTPGKIDVRLWNTGAEKLANPVLVNLLNGDFYALEGATLDNGFWRFDALPLADYPLVITDRKVLA